MGAAVLSSVGLESKLAARPGELSGGQQQRVAIARALINEPSVILADEPTGNLDALLARELADLLFEYRAEKGLALVLVTHDRELSARCDRFLHLEKGLLRSP